VACNPRPRCAIIEDCPPCGFTMKPVLFQNVATLTTVSDVKTTLVRTIVHNTGTAALYLVLFDNAEYIDSFLVPSASVLDLDWEHGFNRLRFLASTVEFSAINSYPAPAVAPTTRFYLVNQP
jgi:hypothetical protein